MGSYKWGRKSPNMGHNCRYPTYNLIIAHEPPSRFKELTQNVTCSFVLLGVMLLPYCTAHPESDSTHGLKELWHGRGTRCVCWVP